MRSTRQSTPAQDLQHHEDGDAVAEAGAGLFGAHDLLGNAAILERLRGLFGSDAGGLSVEDAAAEQLAPIDAAVAGARRLAATGLSALAAGPAAPVSRERFATNFHGEEPGLFSRASEVLSAAAAGLGGPVEVEVESGQPLTDWVMEGDTVGYVWRNVFTGGGVGAIHLCPPFFRQAPEEQAATMLHEATHRWAKTLDHAYGGTSEYRALSAEEALENADTYAHFCKGEQADLDAAQAAQGRAAARAAARDNAALLWAAYQAGEIRLWEDGFTTPDGVALDAELTGTTINSYFRENYPDRCQEAARRLVEEPGAELSWPDGMRLDPVFTRGVDPDPSGSWCG